MSIKHRIAPSARTVTTLLAIAALVLSPSKCKPQKPSGIGTEGICQILDVRLPEAYTPPGAAEPWVQSTVNIACSPPPATSRTVLYLERRNPDTLRWVTLWTARPDLNVPGPAGFAFAVVYPFCEEGTWRVRATIKGTMPNGTPFQPVDAFSKSSRVTC